jgi:hypothetical protein
MSLQFVAFGWRLLREIPLGDQGRRTWLPLPDWINLLSLLAVAITCAVLPLSGHLYPKMANETLAIAYWFIAFHPVSEAMHYRIFFKGGRSVYLIQKDGDYPWSTFEERISVSISVAVALAIGYFFSK